MFLIPTGGRVEDEEFREWGEVVVRELCLRMRTELPTRSRRKSFGERARRARLQDPHDTLAPGLARGLASGCFGSEGFMVHRPSCIGAVCRVCSLQLRGMVAQQAVSEV